MRLLKAEFQKLFSVRATYYILAWCLFMLLVFAFYAEGYHLVADVTDRHKLAGETLQAITNTAVFVALAGVLLMSYEYRHNTIMYTLTSSNSRLKVLAAKIITVSIFAILVTLAIAALSPLFTYIGVHLKGLSMVPQTIPYMDLLWKAAFFGWAYSILALLFASIIRHQVGAIAALFLIPSAVEGLLTLVLKNNVNYLPFTALNMILNPVPAGVSYAMSPLKSVVIVTVWIVVLTVVAAVLFKRRDAN